MRKSRPVDATKQTAHLEQKHQVLKARVQALDSRLHLTTAEQVERQRLKKEKLATKDALLSLRTTA
jgi:hypothetical protein